MEPACEGLTKLSILALHCRAIRQKALNCPPHTLRLFLLLMLAWHHRAKRQSLIERQAGTEPRKLTMPIESSLLQKPKVQQET